MFEFLLYSGIHCIDAKDMIRRIEQDNNLKKRDKIELIETIKDSTPECKWDAND